MTRLNLYIVWSFLAKGVVTIERQHRSCVLPSSLHPYNHEEALQWAARTAIAKASGTHEINGTSSEGNRSRINTVSLPSPPHEMAEAGISHLFNLKPRSYPNEPLDSSENGFSRRNSCPTGRQRRRRGGHHIRQRRRRRYVRPGRSASRRLYVRFFLDDYIEVENVTVTAGGTAENVDANMVASP